MKNERKENALKTLQLKLTQKEKTYAFWPAPSCLLPEQQAEEGEEEMSDETDQAPATGGCNILLELIHRGPDC